MARPQDFSQLRDRAREAHSLLGHSIFNAAVDQLKQTYMQRLLALPAGDPKVIELHAKARMIDELVGELRSMVNDLKFAKKDD